MSGVRNEHEAEKAEVECGAIHPDYDGSHHYEGTCSLLVGHPPFADDEGTEWDHVHFHGGEPSMFWNVAAEPDVPVRAECIHMPDCGCKRVATHSIRGDFCGQQQPHPAHVWTNPIPFGSTAITIPRQCAGLSTPPGTRTDDTEEGACS